MSIYEQPNFLASALGGMQAGQALGRQKRLDAALSGVDLTRPETLMPVLQADPATGAQLYQAAAGVRKTQDATRARELVPGAVGGDKAAINELWGLDADLAGKLTKQHTDRIDQGVKIAGQGALSLLQLPEAQRGQAWDAFIDSVDDQFPELGRFKGQYSPTNLQSVLAQAGLSKDALDITAPRYQALVPGGTLGQTNPFANTPVFNGSAPTPASEGAGSSIASGDRTQFGWTPRARHGGDNSDAAVDGKITGMTGALGIGATDPFPANMTDLQIAKALTLSEGGKGSLADRNNNPGNLIDPSTGQFRKFASKEEGLQAAARQVARNRARGQNTIATMVEGLPAGSARAGLNPPRAGTERIGAGGVKYRFKGGNPADKSNWEAL